MSWRRSCSPLAAPRRKQKFNLWPFLDPPYRKESLPSKSRVGVKLVQLVIQRLLAVNMKLFFFLPHKKLGFEISGWTQLTWYSAFQKCFLHFEVSPLLEEEHLAFLFSQKEMRSARPQPLYVAIANWTVNYVSNVFNWWVVSSYFKVWALGKLNHVAIAVPDLQAATAMYRDMLGADVSGEQVIVNWSWFNFWIPNKKTVVQLRTLFSFVLFNDRFSSLLFEK